MTSRAFGILGAAVLLALVAAGVVFAFGAASPPPIAPQASAALPVSVVTAQPVSDFASRRMYTGLLVAGRTSELSFQRSGKVVAIYFDQGQHVRAGQELAKLDTRGLLAQRDELRARREQAVAVLDELLAGPRQEQIAAAEAEVRQLAAQADWQQARHARRVELRGREVIAQEEYDESRFGLEAAKAQRDAAQRRLDEMLAGTRAEQKEAQKAVVAQLDAALAQLEVDLQDSVLTAPYSGVVARRHLDEGTVITPGARVLRLIEDGRLEAHVGLPPEVAATVFSGEQHDVVIGEATYTTRVDCVLPELDAATRTRTAIFLLPESSRGEVVPGQIVRASISRREDAKGYWLPTASLDRGGRGLWSCLVARADSDGVWRTERRHVEVLHTDADRVLVRGTLSPGERVIAEGVHRLVEGQAVEVLSD
ncbi:MAG: efflux RND transporter periplasmic adaptor subunit [Pirellulaceae bacterium]